MHFILAKVADYSTVKEALQNTHFEEGRFLYSLVFQNKEKTTGYINWTPKEFPHLTNNVVQFTERDGLFLLETSATSNFAEFKRIIEHLTPHAVVGRLKPHVKKEAVEDVFGEHLQSVFEHEKGWYIKSMMTFHERALSLEYSPLTGEGNTSMLLTNPHREEIIEKLLELFFC